MSTEKTKPCPRCGRSIRENDPSCPYCGRADLGCLGCSIDALNDTDERARRFAAQALGEIGDACAVEPLAAFQEAPSDEAETEDEGEGDDTAPTPGLEHGTGETIPFSPSAPGATTCLRKDYRRSFPLTHGEGYKRARNKVGCGTFVVVVAAIIAPVAYYGQEWKYLVVSILGGLCGLWSIIRALGDLLDISQMEERQVKCPFCGHQHTVLMNADWLYCEDCGQLLLLGYSHAEPSLVQIECLYCSRAIGVEQTRRGLGFHCDDCNLKMYTENGVVSKASEETVTCAGCGAVLPLTVFYCRDCGQLTDEGIGELIAFTGIDKRLRKSPRGHLILGKALLHHLQSTVAEREIDRSGIASTNEMLWKLAETWESFEEAALDESLRWQVAESLHPVDHLYAMVLLRLGATYLASRRHYARDAVFCKPGDDNSFSVGQSDHFQWVVQARQAALNRLLATDEIKQSYQFIAWKKASSLIKFKTKTSETGEVKKCWVKNKRQLEDLFEEAERLSPGSTAAAQRLRWF